MKESVSCRLMCSFFLPCLLVGEVYVERTQKWNLFKIACTLAEVKTTFLSLLFNFSATVCLKSLIYTGCYLKLYT